MILALDMFGTLADTAGVEGELSALCGSRAPVVARRWRERQLEYMFRVTAMGLFPTFADLTRWGLVRSLNELGVEVPRDRDLAHLVEGYRRLRPFDDVRPSLTALRDSGHRIVVFSVGPRSWLEDLTGSYAELVDGFVSAEEAGAYKPHPAIYRHLLSSVAAERGEVVVVSSNSFDLIGAGAVGLRTVWCRRAPLALLDPWGAAPERTLASLLELDGALRDGEDRKASGS